VHEIAAITGHVTLKEVERYTKAFDRERLARGDGADDGGQSKERVTMPNAHCVRADTRD
jgi:hypothetical protein